MSLRVQIGDHVGVEACVQEIRRRGKPSVLIFAVHVHVYMLPTDLQPLARFKAVRPVLKPSGPVSKPSLPTYVHVSALFSLAHRLP